MKNNNLIPILILVGVLILFFFPNPEENILAYLGTGLLFVVMVVLLVRSRKKK